MDAAARRHGRQVGGARPGADHSTGELRRRRRTHRRTFRLVGTSRSRRAVRGRLDRRIGEARLERHRSGPCPGDSGRRPPSVGARSAGPVGSRRQARRPGRRRRPRHGPLGALRSSAGRLRRPRLPVTQIGRLLV